MSKQENPNELSPPQEIDLVDLVVVLYRRKVILFLVIAICFMGGALYWFQSNSKSTISMSVETGRNGTELIMAPQASSSLFSSLYLPRYLDVDVDVDVEVLGGGVIGISCELIEGPILEKFQNAVVLALKDLTALHNQISENYLQSRKNLLASKLQELEATKILGVSPGHTAVDWAAQQMIEANIISLQTEIDLSRPSQISDIITITPRHSSGVLLYAVAGLAIGIFCGCCLVFFLELLDQAKSRVSETS